MTLQEPGVSAKKHSAAKVPGLELGEGYGGKWKCTDFGLTRLDSSYPKGGAMLYMVMYHTCDGCLSAAHKRLKR